MNFELLREEKCNSFKYIQRKTTRARFFYKWVEKYRKLPHDSTNNVLLSFVGNVKRKEMLYKYLLKWYINAFKQKNASYSKTELQISSISSEIDENDQRYEEFYGDLRDSVLVKAELETKLSYLDSKISETEDAISQISSHHKESSLSLSEAAINNENLLRRLAEARLKERDEVIELQAKLQLIQDKERDIKTQESTLTPEESIQYVQDAQESYNAKINGIRVLLKNYKNDAVSMRKKYSQEVSKAKKYEQEISTLKEDIKAIEGEIGEIDVGESFVTKPISKPTKKLLKSVLTQLESTREAIIDNESKICKNTATIRSLRIKLFGEK